MPPSLPTYLPFFRNELHLFLTSGSNFKIIYQTHQHMVSPTTLRVLILDSSFNPPHKGHASLVEKSLRHRYDGDIVTIMDTRINSIILLLSVKNADKTKIKPASFEQRLTMMKSLADELSQNGVPVGIGLTDKSLFVDKSELLRNYCDKELLQLPNDNNLHRPNLTFLLGFDTLVRLLNPSYYKEEMRNALRPFFDTSECFVLFRDDGKIGLSDQKNYIKSLNNGELAGIPKEWFEKIHIGQAEVSAIGVSSSEIRNLVKNKTAGWKERTFPDIARFIEDEKLYLD